MVELQYLLREASAYSYVYLVANCIYTQLSACFPLGLSSAVVRGVSKGGAGAPAPPSIATIITSVDVI